jgi:hypothetical protein
MLHAFGQVTAFQKLPLSPTNFLHLIYLFFIALSAQRILTLCSHICIKFVVGTIHTFKTY